MDTTFSEVVKKVIAHYPLTVKNIYLLSYKGKKAVWSIETDVGEVIMKKVPFPAEDIQFMVHAIDYLKSNGIHTPGVYRTHQGEGFVKCDEEYFVVFEAVHGRSPEYEVEDELKMILRGMASFHKASKGIESPTGKFPSFLLIEYKEELERRYKNLLRMKEEREQATDHNEFDEIFLAHVDTFLQQCQQSMSMTNSPAYEKWVEETKLNKSLCHQDYASGNLAIGTDRHLYVYDMDSLTVDLPIRDMRKILNKVMKKEGAGWDLERMLTMMKAYQEVNPLTKQQYRILAGDILFPHLFCGQVTKYYEKKEKKWPFEKHVSRLKEMIATELSKEAVIKDFLSRVEEVIEHGETAKDLALGKELMALHYPQIDVLDMKVIQGGGIKTVWKVVASTGSFCLKRIRKSLPIVEYTTAAQAYLARKGALVADIIPTKDDQLYFVHEGYGLVLYSWIDGTDLDMEENAQHLDIGLKGLAQFHRDSVGFVPKAGSETYDRMGVWPEHFEAMLEELRQWKMEAEQKDTAFHQAFACIVNEMIDQAEQSIQLLKASCYSGWIQEIGKYGYLAHQDYGKGNALLTEKGVYVLDLDNVAYDLPLRDVRKLISKRMAEIGYWDTEEVKRLIRCYESVLSLTEEQQQLIYIDLLFPHKFYGYVKKPFKKDEPGEMKKLLKSYRTEMLKKPFLQQVLNKAERGEV